MDEMNHPMVESEYSLKELAKFILVILTITAVSLLLTRQYGPHSVLGLLRWFMGVFFLVFASFKLIGYKMFPEMFAGYDVIAKRIKAYGYAYPFIELGLAALYLFNIAPGIRDIVTLAIMSVSTIGVAQEVKRRTGVHCACLGNVIKLPLSTVSLVEDLGMGLMALAMLLLR